MIYLGAKLGVNPRRKIFWKPLVDKCNDKLFGWKMSISKQAGRLTLIKSVFNSIHLYWFQIYFIPKGVRDSLDRLRRSFFWGEVGHKYAQDKKKLQLINWERICMPKNKGGLGVGNLKERNQALLLKWWWKWYKYRNCCWWKIIKEKYNLVPHLVLEACAHKRDVSFIMRYICLV